MLPDLAEQLNRIEAKLDQLLAAKTVVGARVAAKEEEKPKGKG